MKDFLGFVLTVAVFGFLSGCEAIKCYWGVTGYLKAVDGCTGSCVETKTQIGTVHSCWPKESDDGCKKVLGIQVCYCNKDLCNSGEMPSTFQESQMESTSVLQYAILANFLLQSSTMSSSDLQSAIMTNLISQSPITPVASVDSSNLISILERLLTDGPRFAGMQNDYQLNVAMPDSYLESVMAFGDLPNDVFGQGGFPDEELSTGRPNQISPTPKTDLKSQEMLADALKAKVNPTDASKADGLLADTFNFEVTAADDPNTEDMLADDLQIKQVLSDDPSPRGMLIDILKARQMQSDNLQSNDFPYFEIDLE